MSLNTPTTPTMYHAVLLQFEASRWKNAKKTDGDRSLWWNSRFLVLPTLHDTKPFPTRNIRFFSCSNISQFTMMKPVFVFVLLFHSGFLALSVQPGCRRLRAEERPSLSALTCRSLADGLRQRYRIASRLAWRCDERMANSSDKNLQFFQH